MKNKDLNMLMLALLLPLAAGCLEGTDPDRYEPGIVPFAELSHEMIELGDRLEDPYTLENMQQSVSNLYPTKAGRTGLTATDLYVRFLPADDAEYERLRLLGLELTDHPLDFEIRREGDFYHDPEVEEGRITWQYAVVPAGFPIPEDLHYELIDECYLPDHAATKAGTPSRPKPIGSRAILPATSRARRPRRLPRKGRSRSWMTSTMAARRSASRGSRWS